MIYLATLLYMLITYYTNEVFLMCNKVNPIYTNEYIEKHRCNILKYKNYT